MTIIDLKNQIVTKELMDTFIIFQYDKEDFIPRQYINEIAKVTGRDIEYLEEIDSLCQTTFSIFGEETLSPTTLRVFSVDDFSCSYAALSEETFLIILAKKIDENTAKLFSNNIVTVPKLVDWQIKDYAYSIAEGVPPKDIDWLISLYGADLYRLNQELDKFRIFDNEERKYLFTDLKNDGAYTDASTYNIFNITNAMAKKDIATLNSVYHELDRVDVNEFGLLTLLLRNFKNIMMVQLQASPTAETSLMESKQFYAVKNLPKVYSAEQLTKIFMFLSDIDRQVKSGELPTDIMIDYMIIKILSM